MLHPVCRLTDASVLMAFESETNAVRDVCVRSGIGQTRSQVMNRGGMGTNQRGMGMPRGRGAIGRAGPVERPFGRGMGGASGGSGVGPPPKWLRMDEPGLFLFNVGDSAELVVAVPI